MPLAMICAAVGAVLLDDSVYKHGGPVGDDKLFKVAPEAQLDAELQIAPVKTPLPISCGASWS